MGVEPTGITGRGAKTTGKNSVAFAALPPFSGRILQRKYSRLYACNIHIKSPKGIGEWKFSLTTTKWFGFGLKHARSDRKFAFQRAFLK